MVSGGTTWWLVNRVERREENFTRTAQFFLSLGLACPDLPHCEVVCFASYVLHHHLVFYETAHGSDFCPVPSYNQQLPRLLNLGLTEISTILCAWIRVGQCHIG